jgi:hypothetical protein
MAISTTVVRRRGPTAFDLKPQPSPAIACTTLVIRFHAVTIPIEAPRSHRGILGIRGHDGSAPAPLPRVQRVPRLCFGPSNLPPLGCAAFV